jgi:hypothetical protein
LEGKSLKNGIMEPVAFAGSVLEGVMLGVETMSEAGRHGRAMPKKAEAGTEVWLLSPRPQHIVVPAAEREQVWKPPADTAT